MAENGRSIHHPFFARLCPRVMARADARGVADHRRTLLASLRGRVIEVGAGNGLNFAHYPASVTEVVAVEPERYLRERAREAARRAPVPVCVVDGLAERLPAEDESFDASVTALVLCTVANPARALAELFRVTRAGGELRFYEHVRAERAGLARVQRIADRLFWPRVAGGCHLSRDTLPAIERAGFVVDACHRFLFKPTVVDRLGAPRILGSARRPLP